MAKGQSQFMPPEIRITLDHMKSGIISMLDEHMLEYTKEIKAGVQKAVDGFDIEKEVCKMAKDELRFAIRATLSHQITKHINFGGGLNKIINKALEKAVSDINGVD